MAEIHGNGELPHIPDDLTIVQFMLDTDHPSRPAPRNHSAWLIEDATGRKITFDEINLRTNALANEFSARWKIAEDDAGMIFAFNWNRSTYSVQSAFSVLIMLITPLLFGPHSA